MRVVAETKPVPFITAFLHGELAAPEREELQSALMDVQHQPALTRALESLRGFVPLAADEAGENVVAKKK